MKSENEQKNSLHPEIHVTKIFYDDRCELCRFSTDLIRGSGIETIPMTGTPFQNSNELILKDENGNTDIGFDAIFNLTGKMAILFPLLPALFLLKISGIGDVAYKIVSRKRHNGKIQWLFSFLNRLRIRNTG